ncbi:MAG: DNA repair protein RecN [Burkholderiaceae bacterium]|jgi:DNA repair protein RecN (Recombination protein N)|nr:DNA repair protein RecN [Burkholderiaceae bacterium]
MSLRHLTLRDFVIVPALDVALNAGFTALTGETGAGKSILVDALQLALGARGDAIWVREGAPRCEISAGFDAPPAAAQWCAEQGFDAGDGDALLVRRAIDRAGKSRAWINGAPATVAQLRALGELLVDIHGQHDWQALTRPASVRGLLDAYGRIDTAPLAAAWRTWQAAGQALDAAQTAQQRLGEERERLLWQIGETEKLAPGMQEWPDLNLRHARLSNAQGLIDAAQTTVQAIEGGDDESSGGALPLLAQAAAALSAQQHIEPEFADAASVLESCTAQLRDVSHGLHAYLGRAETDPEQLAALDERLAQWLGLARRWRLAPEQLPAQLAQWQGELAQLDAQADLAVLQAQAQAAQQAWLALARQISAARGQAAPRLSAAVTAAMQQLGMAGGRFKVALAAQDKPAAHGLEGVQFLVAPHPGAMPRPLERIASGGELSRLALAIAVTTSELGQAPTLVFDEVDAGIGGAVAATVGHMLQRLGHDRQVLCVTHLAQVAACADHHFVVDKRPGADSDASCGVVSTVQAALADARVTEIARMLGGDAASPITRAHAAQFLAQAAQTTPAAKNRHDRHGARDLQETRP